MILPSDGLHNGVGAAAALAYVLAAVGASRWPAPAVTRSVFAAWLLHGAALLVAWLGNHPRFGFAPALSVTAWIAVFVYGLETRLYPQLTIRWAFLTGAAAAVLLAMAFPGRPLNPGESLWLPAHWALGIASYGLFAVAVAHGWYMSRAESVIRLAQAEQPSIPLMTLERLTFRFVEVGFVLLTTTLAVAFLMGDVLYKGGMVRWDHKYVFSILSWLSFAVLLAGRSLFGWRGRRALRVLYLGAGLLLLAYVGSRFVLEVLLGRTL
jgi:ABC-type uncharacterized transport system permease subunit